MPDGDSKTGLKSYLSRPEPDLFNFEEGAVFNQQAPIDRSSKCFPSFFLSKANYNVTGSDTICVSVSCNSLSCSYCPWSCSCSGHFC
jgi:hypothetical protein